MRAEISPAARFLFIDCRYTVCMTFDVFHPPAARMSASDTPRACAKEAKKCRRSWKRYGGKRYLLKNSDHLSVSWLSA